MLKAELQCPMSYLPQQGETNLPGPGPGAPQVSKQTIQVGSAERLETLFCFGPWLKQKLSILLRKTNKCSPGVTQSAPQEK